MKKLIYVCFIALLALSFGCEKEELNIDDNSEKITDNEIANQENTLDIEAKSQSASVENRSSSMTTEGYYDDDGNLVSTYMLYLDMDTIEDNYFGPYTGSFSQHFYNEMSAHFTIHSVEYAYSSCGNIERWVVSKLEYDAYIGINGEIDGIIEINHTDDGNNNSDTASNSNATGWGDANGNVSQTPPTKKKGGPDDDDIPNVTVPTEYEFSFD